jgi:hypothetical protein
MENAKLHGIKVSKILGLNGGFCQKNVRNIANWHIK